MKKKHSLFCIYLLISFFIFSCTTEADNSTTTTRDETDSTNTNKILSYIDIDNAKNLFISESTTLSQSSRNARSINSEIIKKPTIYKIIGDGVIEKVKYYYVDGNDKKEMTISKTPNIISTVNDNFIFIGFNDSEDDSITTAYLVRKSDGATFDMTKIGIPQNSSDSYKNSKIFKFDKIGYMYYLTSNKIVRVDLSDTKNLECSTVSVSTDFVIDFNVDWNGNIIYRGTLVSDSSSPVYRIRKANGGITNLNATTKFWIGLDGNIYYWEDNYTIYELEDGSGGGNSRITKKVTIDSNYNLTDEVYAYYGIDDCGATISNSYLVEMSTRIMLISWNPNYASGSRSDICSVYTDEGSPSNESDFFTSSVYLKSVSDCKAVGDYLFVAGMDSTNNTMLFKYDYTEKKDSATFGKTQILPLNEYDIYSFTISETDGIIFNALRMSDGKKIIGKVGIDGGDVTIIDEEMDAQIEYLQQIN